MTTTVPSTDAPLQPSFYNIQYPNALRGMYSLRQPFKDMSTAVLQPEPQRTPATTIVPQTDLNTEQKKSAPPRQRSKRSAQVQCSLLMPATQHDVAVQTKIDQKPKFAEHIDEDVDDYEYNAPPRVRRLQKPLPPDYRQQVYEIWDVDSSPVRAMPVHPKRQYGMPAQVPRQRLRQPMIEYPDDDEFESDADNVRVVYARRPPPRKANRKTHLPPNVQMMCVRDEAHRASH